MMGNMRRRRRAGNNLKIFPPIGRIRRRKPFQASRRWPRRMRTKKRKGAVIFHDEDCVNSVMVLVKFRFADCSALIVFCRDCSCKAWACCSCSSCLMRFCVVLIACFLTAICSFKTAVFSSQYRIISSSCLPEN